MSFGTELQYFYHARLRHVASDTQIGLMGFHKQPLCTQNHMFVGLGADTQAPISVLSRITAPAQDELWLIDRCTQSNQSQK